MEAQGRKGKGECFKQVKQDLGDWSYLRKEGKSVLQGKGLRESFIMVSKTLLEDVTTNWQIMGIIRMANCPFPFFIRQRTKGLNLWSAELGRIGDIFVTGHVGQCKSIYFLRTKVARSPSERVILTCYFSTRTQFTYYLFSSKNFLNLQSHIWPPPPVFLEPSHTFNRTYATWNYYFVVFSIARPKTTSSSLFFLITEFWMYSKHLINVCNLKYFSIWQSHVNE